MIGLIAAKSSQKSPLSSQGLGWCTVSPCRQGGRHGGRMAPDMAAAMATSMVAATWPPPWRPPCQPQCPQPWLPHDGVRHGAAIRPPWRLPLRPHGGHHGGRHGCRMVAAAMTMAVFYHPKGPVAYHPNPSGKFALNMFYVRSSWTR
jgi:hypothetical protein